MYKNIICSQFQIVYKYIRMKYQYQDDKENIQVHQKSWRAVGVRGLGELCLSYMWNQNAFCQIWHDKDNNALDTVFSRCWTQHK